MAAHRGSGRCVPLLVAPMAIVAVPGPVTAALPQPVTIVSHVTFKRMARLPRESLI